MPLPGCSNQHPINVSGFQQLAVRMYFAGVHFWLGFAGFLNHGLAVFEHARIDIANGNHVYVVAGATYFPDGFGRASRRR